MSIVAKFGAAISDIRSAVCTANELVGDFVCVYGAKVNAVDNVRKANPTNYNLLPAVGVIISKSDDTHCRVQWMGESPAIFTGLSEGEIYFLGANSKIAETPPTAQPGIPVFIQAIAVATADNKAYIRPENNLYQRRN